MNDTLELCEVECEVCRSSGIDVSGEGFGYHFYGKIRTCPVCHGTGKVTVHQWKRIGATSDGRSLRECERCGEVEEVCS